MPKNPAVVAVSGTITPWYDGDMKTTSICRLLKNASEITIDKKIPKPKTKGGSELSVPKSLFIIHLLTSFLLISLILSMSMEKIPPPNQPHMLAIATFRHIKLFRHINTAFLR